MKNIILGIVTSIFFLGATQVLADITVKNSCSGPTAVAFYEVQFGTSGCGASIDFLGFSKGQTRVKRTEANCKYNVYPQWGFFTGGCLNVPSNAKLEFTNTGALKECICKKTS